MSTRRQFLGTLCAGATASVAPASFDGRIPLEAPRDTLHPSNGRLLSPPGAGFGVRLDSAWLAKAKVV
ncbi:MAG: twin-arginine translocation signal domain-containing protein [Opitutaceae bacterium]|nr:twin-arginine translocation signal domain-containing protein [Opitutaceae bacterium]